MAFLARRPIACSLLAVLALSGCAVDNQTLESRVGAIAPRPSEGNDPAGVAVVAALSALVLGYEALSPRQDQHTQRPTDDAFQNAARSVGGPGKD